MKLQGKLFPSVRHKADSLFQNFLAIMSFQQKVKQGELINWLVKSICKHTLLALKPVHLQCQLPSLKFQQWHSYVSLLWSPGVAIEREKKTTPRPYFTTLSAQNSILCKQDITRYHISINLWERDRIHSHVLVDLCAGINHLIPTF